MLLLLSLLMGCFGDGKREDGTYSIRNIKIYKDTPAWELARAVDRGDVKKIAKLGKESPDILDYQDPTYGTTLLYWAVAKEKYKSAEALLKAGADPDIISTYDGGTALYRAAGFSWVDMQAKQDAKYVKLLLEYGADPNITFAGGVWNTSTEVGYSPLMRSIGCGIEKTKALVEGGADINYQTPESKRTAAIKALYLAWGKRDPEAAVEVMEYARYLILEKGAVISALYYSAPPYMRNEEKKELKTINLLRRWYPTLGTDEYQLKMDFVEEFKRHGLDYWSSEIPDYCLQEIKQYYPDTWEEYIKVY